MSVVISIAKAIGIRGGLAIVAVGLAVWFWFAWGAAADKRDALAIDLRDANAAIAVLQTDAELKELAALQRQADNAASAETEKELSDAVKDVIDTAPDAVRVQLGCERLRRAGTAAADLPALCRSASASEAGPAA